jgi:hypothetical protein
MIDLLHRALDHGVDLAEGEVERSTVHSTRHACDGTPLGATSDDFFSEPTANQSQPPVFAPMHEVNVTRLEWLSSAASRQQCTVDGFRK